MAWQPAKFAASQLGLRPVWHAPLSLDGEQAAVTVHCFCARTASVSAHAPVCLSLEAMLCCWRRVRTASLTHCVVPLALLASSLVALYRVCCVVVGCSVVRVGPACPCAVLVCGVGSGAAFTFLIRLPACNQIGITVVACVSGSVVLACDSLGSRRLSRSCPRLCVVSPHIN